MAMSIAITNLCRDNAGCDTLNIDQLPPTIQIIFNITGSDHFNSVCFLLLQIMAFEVCRGQIQIIENWIYKNLRIARIWVIPLKVLFMPLCFN
jgi:hypothetical protein